MPDDRSNGRWHPLDALALVGRVTIEALQLVGRVALFGAEALSHAVRPPFYLREFGRAFAEVAFFSLPVVALTALFSGAVIALQSYTGFARFNAASATAAVVVLSVVRELGPVLAGLMVSGRVGASMAAELGTMRVTDQIDALSTLSTDPMKFLVTPRVLAGLLGVPILVVADILGVAGGWLVAVGVIGFQSRPYLTSTMSILTVPDVTVGLVKAAVFGFIVALMGCYYGYRSRGGAEGVGTATTSAVVTASILIFAFDYLLTELFFSK